MSPCPVTLSPTTGRPDKKHFQLSGVPGPRLPLPPTLSVVHVAPLKVFAASGGTGDDADEDIAAHFEISISEVEPVVEPQASTLLYT